MHFDVQKVFATYRDELPLVGDELPHLKGLIIAYIIHIMLSFPGEMTSNRKKNQWKVEEK